MTQVRKTFNAVFLMFGTGNLRAHYAMCLLYNTVICHARYSYNELLKLPSVAMLTKDKFTLGVKALWRLALAIGYKV